MNKWERLQAVNRKNISETQSQKERKDFIVKNLLKLSVREHASWSVSVFLEIKAFYTKTDDKIIIKEKLNETE